MLYESTRGGVSGVTAADVIKTGIAPDGGLFVPAEGVLFSREDIEALKGMDYRERAIKILSPYLDDFGMQKTREFVYNAYNTEKFDDERIAPLVKLSDQLFAQELWHGPTSAFKDIALQILPYLLVEALKKTSDDNEAVILVATSGDTGKAALEGFKDVEGTRVIVFYPEKGVSEIQKHQMITQEGSNVYTVGVRGNFDDAQSGVKAIFADKELAERMKSKGLAFSSANSINWGRLVPQIVYYFSAYADLLYMGEIENGETINIVVPTGNFGNILAAYYAYKMGLPVNRLICAANENNVLTEFIVTGIYNRNREFKKTISPSMDILISSNLERLLYDMSGRSSSSVLNWMTKLSEEGMYTIDDDTHRKISELFWSEYSDERETLNTIKSVYDEYNYVVDTHTAVGIDVYDKYVISTGDVRKAVVASTASPFKFNASVAEALLPRETIEGRSEFELLDILSQELGLNVPKGLKGLDKKEIRHTAVCSPEGMKNQVECILGL
jgi:threonine synthase